MNVTIFKIFFILTFLFLISRCVHTSSNNVKKKVSNSHININEVIKCFKDRNFKILKIQKWDDNSPHLNSYYSIHCQNWGVDSFEIIKILPYFKQISSYEYYELYEYLPCNNIVECKINEKIKVIININAGSTAQITLNDTIYCLGYFGSNNSFFIEHSFIDELNE